MKKSEILVLLFLFVNAAWAMDGPGTKGFHFLRSDAGARPAGMGGAFLAIAGDVDAIYYNPAGLASIDNRCASFTYLNDLLDFNTGVAGYARPKTYRGTLAIGVLYKSYGSFKKTDTQGQEIGEFSANNIALSVSYGQKVYKELQAGATVKYIRSTIDTYSSDAIAMDLGVLYSFPKQMLTVAAGLFNMGYVTSAFIQQKDDLPLNARIGISKRLAHLPLLVSLVVYKYDQEKMQGCIGGEFTLAKNLFLRLGYDSMGRDFEVNPSKDRFAGSALGLGLLWDDFRFDYAFTSYGALGSLNRLTVSGNF
jgi:hypothetical protein